MRTARFLLTTAAALAFAVTASAQTKPATPPMHEHAQQQPAKGTAPAKTMDMAECQKMMQAHQAMMEKMKTMDAQLDTLVQQMDTATGQAKIDATAAVVKEMVTQRKTMRDEMETMQSGMMQHMMGHMQAGTAMQCPMMQSMDQKKK